MKIPLLLPLLLAGSCGWNAAGITGCRPVGQTRGLPDILKETSGATFSRSRPEIFFSHNDSGHEATIYALDLTGSLVGEIRLSGIKNRDWEDMASGECPSGDCIYIADVGDNQEIRDEVHLYRIPDPGVYDGSPQEADVFPMTLPGGPRDMEALFVLPGEDVFFVSKGRSNSVTLYRYPPPLRAGETVMLEAVQNLTDGRQPIPKQLTGADASADGKIVALRSYEALTFYSWKSGQLVPVEGGRIVLRTLNETQGEAVALGPGGQVVLTSEAALGKGATLTVLECRERVAQG